MYKIPMNLQMYAEGGEGPDIADPVSEELAEVVDFVDPEGDKGEKDPEPADPGIDENAIYAEARRTAEKQMNAMNARVMSRFAGMTNPETGQPIKTVADYFEALDAQERVNTIFLKCSLYTTRWLTALLTTFAIMATVLSLREEVSMISCSV